MKRDLFAVFEVNSERDERVGIARRFAVFHNRFGIFKITYGERYVSRRIARHLINAAAHLPFVGRYVGEPVCVVDFERTQFRRDFMPHDFNHPHAGIRFCGVNGFSVYKAIVSVRGFLYSERYVLMRNQALEIALGQKNGCRAITAVAFVFNDFRAWFFKAVNTGVFVITLTVRVAFVAVVHVINDIFITENSVRKRASAMSFSTVLPVAGIAEFRLNGYIFRVRHRTEKRMSVTVHDKRRIRRDEIIVIFISVIIFAVKVVHAVHDSLISRIVFHRAALTVALNERKIEKHRLRKRQYAQNADDIPEFYVEILHADEREQKYERYREKQNPGNFQAAFRMGERREKTTERHISFAHGRPLHKRGNELARFVIAVVNEIEKSEREEQARTNKNANYNYAYRRP